MRFVLSLQILFGPPDACGDSFRLYTDKCGRAIHFLQEFHRLHLDLSFASCQGANNENNDLEAFVQQLVNDGNLGEAEQDIFRTRVVGDNNCPSKRDELLSNAGFESGFVIDESRWQFIVGKCEVAVFMVREV